MVGADGYADAHGCIDFLAQQVERDRQCLLDTRGDGACFFFAGHVVEQHGKLISTHAAEHVALSQTGFDSLRDLDQQLISAAVAETIVDQLEAIDVEQQHCILPGFV